MPPWFRETRLSFLTARYFLASRPFNLIVFSLSQSEREFFILEMRRRRKIGDRNVSYQRPSSSFLASIKLLDYASSSSSPSFHLLSRRTNDNETV